MERTQKVDLRRALDTAQARGAAYADLRVVRLRTETIVVRNGKVESLASRESHGFGVRALVKGAWGFAASSHLEPRELDRVAAQAVSLARASVRVRGQAVELGEPVSLRASYRTPVQINPFSVPLGDKVSLLLSACAEMQAVPSIRAAEASVEMVQMEKTFLSTDGSSIEQTIIETGCGLEATAVSEGEMQRRSYPNSVGRHQTTEGWEFVLRWDLSGNARRVAEEAAALLKAKPCPSEVTTIILDGSQLALQVHESCGHPIELDRVLGTEADYAGTSFLTPDKLGAFRYGSEKVNITADATVPGGLGTFGYDDEGVPAQKVPIVRDGIFVGYLTSRETAARLGQRSNGAMRAESWAHLPLIRMTNINLEPGEWTLDDLIADTNHGLYLETNRSWSIDDRRLNFQFGTEYAREIKKGKLGDLVKNATYTGMTPQFWASCDAICNRGHWIVWGTPNCGKGQPSQAAHVGHGASPARFRNVQVGLMKPS
ncbi:MAG: TldD/PmbA family protein [Chloroflexi bacterium]|nr:TldD/PmbA family protein [Chloroflexota bacterium]